MLSSSEELKKKMKVVIISKPRHPELVTLVPRLVAWLKEHGYEVAVDEETAPVAKGAKRVRAVASLRRSRISSSSSEAMEPCSLQRARWLKTTSPFLR